MKSLSFPVTGKQIDGGGMVVGTEYKSFSMQHRDKYDEWMNWRRQRGFKLSGESRYDKIY